MEQNGFKLTFTRGIFTSTIEIRTDTWDWHEDKIFRDWLKSLHENNLAEMDMMNSLKEQQSNKRKSK